jgi:hypothetical protein
MQRTFLYQKTQKTEGKETVDLPVYSKHDLDTTVCYRKLFARTEHGYVMQSIDVHDDGEVAFKEEMRMGCDLGMNADYYLGKGEFASSKEEWTKALRRAQESLSFYEP